MGGSSIRTWVKRTKHAALRVPFDRELNDQFLTHALYQRKVSQTNDGQRRRVQYMVLFAIQALCTEFYFALKIAQVNPDIY